MCRPTGGAPPPDEAALRAFLREHHTRFRIGCSPSEQIALTQNAKVQLAPLREAALARLAAEGPIVGHCY